MASVERSMSSQLDAIVLIGSFNPLILDPFWLQQNGIISEADLEYAQDSRRWIATSDFAQIEFRTFALQAERERVQVALSEEAETPLLLADVVVNTFGLLAHTPVTAVGLNHSAHRALDEARAEEILDRLAPAEAVGDLLPGINVNSLNWNGERPDDYAGRLLLSVQPSLRLQGLFFSLNDHFDLGERGTGRTAVDLVGNEWQPSLQRADELFDKVLGL